MPPASVVKALVTIALIAILVGTCSMGFRVLSMLESIVGATAKATAFCIILRAQLLPIAQFILSRMWGARSPQLPIGDIYADSSATDLVINFDSVGQGLGWAPLAIAAAWPTSIVGFFVTRLFCFIASRFGRL